MLVLTRRRGERVLIGDDIEVAVVEVRGDRVKLAFKAPLDVPIHREELRHRLALGQAEPRQPECPLPS